jgi:hypothetical protein
MGGPGIFLPAFTIVAVKDENPTRTLFCASWSPMFSKIFIEWGSGSGLFAECEADHGDRHKI